MPGSTLIHAPDESSLVELASHPEGIERFTYVELEVLATLDFTSLVPAHLQWGAPEPVAFDEEQGLAIFRVQPDALAYLLDHEAALSLDSEQRSDLGRIRAFVAAHGAGSIYELATF